MKKLLLCVMLALSACATSIGQAVTMTSLPVTDPGVHAEKSVNGGEESIETSGRCRASREDISTARKTEILREIKRAIDEERLIRPDFFTRQALAEFFCASIFRWSSDYETVRVEISGYGSLYEVPLKYPNTPIYIEYSSVERKSHLRLPRLDSELDARAVIAAFGDSYTIENPYSADNLRHPRLLAKPTSEFGNRALAYKFSGPRSDATVSATIAADGAVESLTINEEARK